MPVNVFGNSSINSDNKIDTSLFVQKPDLSTNYIEANIEEDVDLKNQYRIKKLPDPLDIREPTTQTYVDNILKNDIDFNDNKLEIIKFVKVNYQPAVIEHLTPKLYVENAIDEISLIRNFQDNDINNYNSTDISNLTLSTQAVNDDHVFTKAYVDQFHQENEGTQRDLGLDFYNESNDLVKNNHDKNSNDNKLTTLESLSVNKNPILNKKVTNKKYFHDEMNKNTIVRFDRTLENYLKVSVGKDTNNLTK